MTHRHSLGSQAIRRLFLALVLSGLLNTLVGVWVYYTANKQAVIAEQTSARNHYINVIADLERRWGREAFNFKIRLESQRFLESTTQQKEKLLAYLTSQGGSIEFPSLRIESAKGEVIASFEYVGNSIPNTRFLPGQESTWAFDAKNNQVFLVFRQLIWLGKENGYLLLFRPMDHALLYQFTYPHTRLSLWWKGKPVASSDGEDGLAVAALTFQKMNLPQSQSMLPWSGNDNENTPRLFIETTAPPLLTIGELAAPLAISLLVFAIAIWGILGAWGTHTMRRILSLERAQNRFLIERKIDATVNQDLRIAHGHDQDEITALAASFEHLMQELSNDTPSTRENPEIRDLS